MEINEDSGAITDPEEEYFRSIGKIVIGSIQPKSTNRWRAHILELSEIWTVGLYCPKQLIFQISPISDN
jgi:hypothetical protein